MADKTGAGELSGTAEGAITSRAVHARYADPPVFDDSWAIHLLTPEAQADIIDPVRFAEKMRPDQDAMAWISSIGIGCLRYAEDEVERCATNGFVSYVVLGAGFDTFAFRKGNLINVIEIDHPDVQALKRSRVAAAPVQPRGLPHYIPVDFEHQQISTALIDNGFDTDKPSVFSFLNTVPYLTVGAVTKTLLDVGTVAPPGSRLVVNYSASGLTLNDEQVGNIESLLDSVERRGEPMRSHFAPDAFESLLDDAGFDIVEHATEDTLIDRYFATRTDGFSPGLPVRIVTAQRRA